ncbi:MAG: hypothetical protein LBH01_07145 [Verrucomicrobiales bacterium]|jgi:hypothetical protein|nr:hypothetical protein [Verrucomicrobiales bacterium]
MQKTALSLLLASLLVGCSPSPSNTSDPSRSTGSYRENNPNAEAGVDTPIWSSNPNKPTVTKRIEDSTNQ